ncbi:MAG TPA: hypothetical protein VEG60_18790 [Candidatus Binatia bacterium]|nr:hypothetical protein [Candidatus Binatia bacterium]
MADEKGKPEGGKEFQLEAQVDGEKNPRADAGEWIPAFLATLATTANIYLACRQAGITRKTAYKWKEENEEFAARWKDAMEDACDILEWDGRRRARASSDKLLMYLLDVHATAGSTSTSTAAREAARSR